MTSLEPLVQIQNYFTELFVKRPSTKIAQIALLSQRKGSPDLDDKSSLQCYSVLSDILVKNELYIPSERGSNVLSTGEGFICLSPPVGLKSLCVSVLSTKRQFRSVL